MNTSDYQNTLENALQQNDSEVCYNAVTRFRYVFDGVMPYTINTCDPTGEAKRNGIKHGTRFFVNGTPYIFDGKQAESESNLVARQIQSDLRIDEKVMQRVFKLSGKRDKAGLQALLAKVQHPRNRQYLEQVIESLS